MQYRKTGPPRRLRPRPSPRRILLVAPQPFYADRGTPIAVRQVLEALSELGYEVDVLTYPVGAPVDIPGVRIFRCRNPFRIRRVPIGLSLRKLVLDASLLPALLRRLNTTRYDCIHAVEEAAFPAVWLGARRGIPVVYDMQSSLPEQLTKFPLFRIPPAQWLLRRCEKWVIDRAHTVLSSAGLARRVREAVPGADVREWVFSASVGTATPEESRDLRGELGIPHSHRVVMYTGSFESYQGLDNLVAAMPNICQRTPNTTVVLAGAENGSGRDLLERAQKMHLDDRLLVLPRQPRERMRVFLSIADVLVSPRAYGGNLPLKVFDYMSSRRPIVATDIATHRTVLNDERAVLVGPRPEEIAEGISRVLEDAALAGALVEAAHSFAQERLGWSSFVQGLHRAYRQVLGARAAAA